MVGRRILCPNLGVVVWEKGFFHMVCVCACVCGGVLTTDILGGQLLVAHHALASQTLARAVSSTKIERLASMNPPVRRLSLSLAPSPLPFRPPCGARGRPTLGTI